MPEESQAKFSESVDTDAAAKKSEQIREQANESASENRAECANGVCAVVWKPQRTAA